MCSRAFERRETADKMCGVAFRIEIHLLFFFPRPLFQTIEIEVDG